MEPPAGAPAAGLLRGMKILYSGSAPEPPEPDLDPGRAW